jgi:predicted Zn-ribbon and HTH transcriptional regulator
MTRREEIIELLRKEEMTSEQLAHYFQTKKKTIVSDLKHIRKTLKGKNMYLAIRMPACRNCNFEFKLNSVKEPSKCPKCNSTWIEPPIYKVIT